MRKYDNCITILYRLQRVYYFKIYRVLTKYLNLLRSFLVNPNTYIHEAQIQNVIIPPTNNGNSLILKNISIK